MAGNWNLFVQFIRQYSQKYELQLFVLFRAPSFVSNELLSTSIFSGSKPVSLLILFC